MKKTILVIILLLISVSAYAQQKLVNITEDTTQDNSYKPVAGKEVLVAVKLVDVDTNNQEQPMSNEAIEFQTSAGILSDTEVSTNIYGEAITWLRTNTTPDITHTITAQVKNNNDVQPVTITVENIALPQDAPTTEQLLLKVEENNAKIEDIKGDITVTSNTPWSAPLRQLKIWRKGKKQKVEEISPKPRVFMRPELQPILNPPQILKEIVAYNSQLGIYVVYSKEETQDAKFPYNLDYVDNIKDIIVRAESYIGEGDAIRKFVTEDSNFMQVDTIWIFMEEKKYMYEGTGRLKYTDQFIYSNLELNTGIPDTIFQ